MGSNGKQKDGNLKAAMAAIRSSPVLTEAFARDEMQKLVMLQRPLPFKGSDQVGNGDDLPRAIQETDLSQVQEFLQRHGLPKLTKGTVYQAVELRAAERAFHPVRDWLSGLAWDRQPRIAGWVSSYLGAEDTPYTKGIGAMFLIAMVARVFDPGCKADYVMVLEGPQGARKSTACSILGAPWFSDSLPDVTSGKDVSLHLRGKWLIEIAEMSAMSKADHAALKAFISRPVERYRAPYGRSEVVEPRQCLFVGTTNQSRYLRDETGGRRYWPVRVGKIDTDRLAADRDQLFAEAVAAHRDHRQWWPDAAFEAEHIRPEQDDRFEADVWEEAIASFLVDQSKITVTEVANRALHMPSGRVATHDTRRITSCLERLGWERGRKDRDGRIRWVRGSIQ